MENMHLVTNGHSVKYHSDNSLERYETRLVTKNESQNKGIDHIDISYVTKMVMLLHKISH